MNPLRRLVYAIRDALALDVGLQELGSDARYPVHRYSERVSDDLIRGSRPGGFEAELAKEYGLRGAVNLCAERCDTNWPAQMWSAQIPVVDNTAPTKFQALQFLEFVRLHAPVYVHCEAGVGRTSVFVACYRMAVQGWTAERAIQEARQHGMANEAQEEFLRSWTP